FIVGHVIVGGALWLEIALAPPTWLHLAIWLPLTLVMSLLLLPRIKGSLVGLQWALRMDGFGGGEARGSESGLPSHENGPNLLMGTSNGPRDDHSSNRKGNRARTDDGETARA